MKTNWDTVFTATLVASAAMIAVVLVHREFFSSSAAVVENPQPVFLENWRDYLDKGKLLGRSDAPVQIIEFGDYECPFCASLQNDLKALRSRYSEELAITYVHFPLEYHRFAIPAARVAECAGLQGRFEAMHDVLFEQQNAFGLTSWVTMATQAAVPDLPKFDECVGSNEEVSGVLAGKKLGNEINVDFTPTLIVNGWKLGYLPSAAELESMIKAVLAGRSPVGET